MSGLPPGLLLRRGLHLARWLGPWAEATASPPGVARRAVTVNGDRPFQAWVWRRADRPPDGALLLLPGLHFLGPSDPRFERLARIIAGAGLLVLAPFLPDFERLEVAPTLFRDAEASLDALLAQPEMPDVRPGVFSISFGSLPALQLAAARGRELGSLLVFGGFHDLRRTLRFALGGDAARPHDPLNAPVVFLNLLPHLEVAPALRDPLAAAWREQCRRTWGRPELRHGDAHVEVARALSASLPEAARELFLIGARAAPGTEALALDALARAGSAFDWVGLDAALPRIACDVHLVHGRADDVIPHEESASLYEALHPHVRTALHLTGLYGHTAHAGQGALLRAPQAWTQEALSMAAILGALARASR